MPRLEIIKTEDQSITLFSKQFSEHYHSIHGARAESLKIFIEYGLEYAISLGNKELNIFEVGFGTGLNALLSQQIAELKNIKINYSSIELYPIEKPIYQEIANNFDDTEKDIFIKIHEAKWNEFISICPNFNLRKIHRSLLDFNIKDDNHLRNNINIVYFDAFSPDTQSEMWSEIIFRNLYENMKVGSVLTTYCAKGEIRRRLKYIGFEVERLEGPPYKREVLRASKI